MNDLLMKTSPLELDPNAKIVDGKYIFKGWLFEFNVTDLQGDRIMPGSFDETVKWWKSQKNQIIPIVSNHWDDIGIGGIEKYEIKRQGLWAEKAFIDADIKEGRRFISGIQKRYIRGMSIGGQFMETSGQPFQPFRKIERARLQHVTPTPQPAQTGATTELAKNMLHMIAADPSGFFDGASFHKSEIDQIIGGLRTIRKGTSADEQALLKSMIDLNINMQKTIGAKNA